jgi:hypothetical protein
MPFALNGKQATAKGLGETDATLVRSGWITGDGHDQCLRESFDVLSIRVTKGRLHWPVLTDVAGFDGSTSIKTVRP